MYQLVGDALAGALLVPRCISSSSCISFFLGLDIINHFLMLCTVHKVIKVSLVAGGGEEVVVQGNKCKRCQGRY